MQDSDSQKKSTTTPGILEPVLRVLDHAFEDGFTRVEQLSSLRLHSEKISGMLRLLRDSASGSRTRSELGLACSALELLSSESFRGSAKTEIDLRNMDRPALLLNLCEQIIGCAAIAKSLEMDIAGALVATEGHILVRGGWSENGSSPIRQIEVRLPGGKIDLLEFT